MKIEQLAELTDADRAAIVEPLDSFSRNRGYVWQPKPLALVLREDTGGIAGGLIGTTQWEWLRIDILAVAETHRGSGWGRLLIQEAEKVAVSAGCHSAWVDTFSFQSPDFYSRLGYQVFGELADYPKGQTRYFLAKKLLSGQAEP